MKPHCPYCNGTGHYAAPNADAAENYLRRQAKELGIAWSWEETVGTTEAAQLLGKSVSFMEKDRDGERAIPCYQRGSRWAYPRRGLAEFLAR